MPKDLIVAITVGQRDLQVLAVNQNEKLHRVIPDRRQVGLLHRALLEKQLACEVWMPDDPKDDLPEAERVEARLDNGRIGFDHDGWRLANANDLPSVDVEKPVDVWMVPGILWEKLRLLQHDVQSGDYRLCRVVVFHTDRGKGHYRAKGEPVAVAPIVGDWIRVNISRDPPSEVQLVAFLEVGDDDFNVEDDLGNSWFLPKAANKIIDAIHQAVRNYPDAYMRLHLAGGIPKAPEFVEATARFYFPGRVEHRSPSETRPQPKKGAKQQRFSPIQELQTRHRCRDLVRHGQFESALALADSLDWDKSETSIWREGLRRAALFFQGYVEDAGEKLDDFDSPLKTTLETLLNRDQPQALHVAFRVEAALRAYNFLLAASLTKTFVDVMLLDAIEQTFSNPGQNCIEWKNRRILVPSLNVSEADIRSWAAQCLQQQQTISRRNPQSWINDWFAEDPLTLKRDWQNETLLIALKISRQDSLSEKMAQFQKDFNRKNTNGNSPANYRNMIIHSVLPQSSIKSALDMFVKRKLWVQEPESSFTFLASGGQANTILNYLRINNAFDLYEKMVENLVADIENCPLTI